MYEALSSGFPKDLDKPALILADGGEVSYAALQALSGRMANLIVGLNISPGDRVLVQVEKSWQSLALWLACMRAGTVFVPLNTAYRGELDYFIGDAAPKLLVVDPDRVSEIAPLAASHQVPHMLSLGADGAGSLMDELAGAPEAFSNRPCSGDDVAAILYTSGTTGRSKGAMLTQANLVSNAHTLVEIWGFDAEDVLLHALPIYHVHGLFIACHCALMSGSTMLWLDKFDADAVMRLLPQATVMMGVPTFYTRLLDQPDFGQAQCAHMRLFISGSAPLLAETHTEFQARTGLRILERYGMSEAGMITSNPLEGDRVAGTVGYALPEVSIRVANEDGQELPPGEVGILEAKGPNIFAGYWQMPEKTASEFRADGYFITGDMAVMAEDGRVTLVGRAKDLIISGGLNIYPKEIELLIDAVDGIGESAVIGLPHPDFGETVAAVCTRTGEVDEDQVRAALKDQIASFKQPKAVFFVDALPRNAMGKVQKNLLRSDYGDTFIGTIAAAQ